MAKPQRLSYTAKRQIDDHLRSLLTKGEDGLFAYPEGQNDSTVARQFGCNPSHVAGIRNEAFGAIRKARKTSMEDRLRIIEKYLDETTPGWRQHKFKMEVVTG